MSSERITPERLEILSAQKFEGAPVSQEMLAALVAERAFTQKLENVYSLALDSVHRMASWCRAYPESLFKELTKNEWHTAHAELDKIQKGLGTRIAASNMRHVVKGVEEITTELYKLLESIEWE